ncbi:hypothetical protein BpHYR1_040438 [Brachionus plicatilis]|uniref:Uncharacterized protein n=1 Tax=Brachionus plicatilis TaxID=10195 RepID=A0A3M7QX55_BRAPC|nr:hypothetical protein BpHYR1_040438 [Brachionus plicatilis]
MHCLKNHVSVFTLKNKFRLYKLKLTCMHFVPRLFLYFSFPRPFLSLTFSPRKGRVEEKKESRKSYLSPDFSSSSSKLQYRQNRKKKSQNQKI